VTEQRAVLHRPYNGLEAFDRSRRRYFFGRSTDERIILTNVCTSRLTVLYGASGVGKTSILQASIYPELLLRANSLPVLYREWQRQDFEESLRLACVAAFVRAGGVAAELVNRTHLDDVVDAMCKGTERSVHIILDQFDEYLSYTESRNERLDSDLSRIINRLNLNATVLISIREESLGKLDRFHHRIRNVLANTLRLGPLDGTGAREAIERPLDVYNEGVSSDTDRVSIEPALVERLLTDAATSRQTLYDDAGSPVSGGAPAQAIDPTVLQLTLSRLWDHSRTLGHPMIALADYDQLGGVSRIAGSYVKEVVAALSRSERFLVAKALRYLVAPSGTKFACSAADLADQIGATTEASIATLDKLTIGSGRLLRRPDAAAPPRRMSPNAGRVPDETATYELLHDALGPQAATWSRDELQAHRRYRRAATIGIIGACVVALMSCGGYGYRRWSIWRRTAAEAITDFTNQVEAADHKAKVRELISRTSEDSFVLARYALEANGTLLPGDVAEAQDVTQMLNRAAQAVRPHETFRFPARITGLAGGWNQGLLAITVEGTGLYTWRTSQVRPTLCAGSVAFGGPVVHVSISDTGARIGVLFRQGLAAVYPLDQTNQCGHASWSSVSAGSAAKGAMVSALSVVDGPSIIAAGYSDGRVVVWSDRASAQAVADPNGDPVTGVSIAKSARMIVIASASGIVKVCADRDGAYHCTQLDKPYSSPIIQISEGAGVIAVSSGRHVDIWQQKDTNGTNEVEFHLTYSQSLTTTSTGLAMAPTGARLLLSGNDGKVRLLRGLDASEILTIAAHSAPISQSAPVGSEWIASAANDQEVKIWKLPSYVHNAELTSLWEDREVLTTSHGSVCRWRLDTGSLIECNHHKPAALFAANYAPEGLQITLRDSERIYFGRPGTPKQDKGPSVANLDAVMIPSVGCVKAHAKGTRRLIGLWIPKDRRLATWSTPVVSETCDYSSARHLGVSAGDDAGRGSIVSWLRDDGTVKSVPFEQRIRSIKLMAGEYAVVGTDGGNVALLDVAGHLVGQSNVDGSPILAVSATNDGNEIACGSFRGEVAVFEVKKNELIRRFGFAQDWPTAFVEVAASIVTASDGPLVRLYDLDRSRLAKQLAEELTRSTVISVN
jgi:WD40 repeat protein